MATTSQWKTLRVTTKKKLTRGIIVKEHPLKSVTPVRINHGNPMDGSSHSRILDKSKIPLMSYAMSELDPLSEFALEMDPLSKAVAETNSLKLSEPALKKQEGNECNTKMEPWSTRKIGILSKYTTSEKLSIITSFLPSGDKVLVKAQSISVDKVQYRLEQLDTFEDGTQKKTNLSQTEYIGQIEQLNKELVSAWNTEQRVKALKIAIQCAKLLADTDVLQFYPSKFVLVTDILETFGKIVYERLKSKAEPAKPASNLNTSLPNEFSPNMIAESAKETCLNWFFKIASIRELVPRVYVEMALIKSYNFISTHDLPNALLRISDMIVGIGNPLVAVYARCYLCIVGINAVKDKLDYKFLQNCLKSFLDSYQHIFSRCVISETHAQKMSMISYLTLYTPALNFIIEATLCYTDESLLPNLFGICRRLKNSSLLLHAILSVFKPVTISGKILEVLDLIEHCADYQAVPLSVLIKSLGDSVNTCSPPIEHTSLVLSIVSRHLGTITNVTEFMFCMDAWIIYFVRHLPNRDLNTLFGDIIKRLSPNRTYENHYKELKIIIDKVLSNAQDFESLLTLENFLLLIDLFHEDVMKVEVCKNILIHSNNEQKTNDPVVINTLMYLCNIIHDSVHALLPEDECRQIGEIICGILRRIYFGKDFEQQLNFYVLARGAFYNLDLVLAELVQQVNTLSVKARQAVKGLHTKKSGDFVRACAAYCFITIPSVISEQTRLQLYLLSGQVSLFNQCFGQAEACFKAAWSILAKLKEPFSQRGAFVVPYIKQTISALLVLPDNPERGVLSILRLLLNTLKSLEIEDDHNLALLYISVINMLTVMAQEEYLYKIDKVESNDTLYGADPKFVTEIDRICSVLLGEIKISMSKHRGSQTQYVIARELFYTITTRADLSENSMQTLALDLWEIMLRTKQFNKKNIADTRLHLENLSKIRNNKLYEDFILQLRLS